MRKDSPSQPDVRMKGIRYGLIDLRRFLHFLPYEV